MDISRAKLLVFWLCSTLLSIINGQLREIVIPSSFLTLDPYAEAQHHYESVTPGYYKPQVLPQVSHDPPLSYNVVPGDPYDLLHQINQQSLISQYEQTHHQSHLDHEPHYQQTHHQPQYEQTHHQSHLDHQPHYQQTHHQPQYNQHRKPIYKPHTQKLYKPHAVKLPVTPHVAQDKHFISQLSHTQHLTYIPPKIQKLIKKTPLDFPKKGYFSHKLAPARDDYARKLYFPTSGYNIDKYFYDFPAFGYFDYEPKPKLHGLDHHRRRRMLNFNDIDVSKGHYDISFIPKAKATVKDSTLTQKRIARSSTNDNLSSQKMQNVEDSPPAITLLQRSPRTSAMFPRAPMLPRLLEPRSAHDKENTWLNQ